MHIAYQDHHHISGDTVYGVLKSAVSMRCIRGTRSIILHIISVIKVLRRAFANSGAIVFGWTAFRFNVSRPRSSSSWHTSFSFANSSNVCEILDADWEMLRNFEKVQRGVKLYDLLSTRCRTYVGANASHACSKAATDVAVVQDSR
eukprot:5606-Heterococcus_DN1.PRE.1